MSTDAFWEMLQTLVADCPFTVDRPKGTPHPRYSDYIYPFDYGYLEGTVSGDGGGIDAWVGSLPEWMVSGIICTIDLEKRDSEVKVLLGCTPEEMQQILQIHNSGSQAAVLLERSVFSQKAGS